jgi:hypothetical protein
VTDFPAEKPPVARAYCPGCEPAADPLREILDVHWCDSHAPCRAGSDDVLATARGTAYGSAEAGGEDNRRWCELIHRGRALRESGPRPRGDPEHALEQDVSAERDQEA